MEQLIPTGRTSSTQSLVFIIHSHRSSVKSSTCYTCATIQWHALLNDTACHKHMKREQRFTNKQTNTNSALRQSTIPIASALRKPTTLICNAPSQHYCMVLTRLLVLLWLLRGMRRCLSIASTDLGEPLCKRHQ